MASLSISPQASAASSSMASSSSAPTSYSPPPWDVFINHRGPDVKRTFASYLYRSLVSRGLKVFLDIEELKAGQNISSQIEQAIRGASVHIAIFSPTYAESTWCLDELVLMVDSVKSGKIILPIFYKVEPFEVRYTVKGGAYAHALRKLQQKTELDPETGKEWPRYNSDNFRKWRGALSFAADLSGFLIRDEDDEGELLDKVVESVLKSVPKPPLDVAKYPTGLNQKLEEFETTVLQKQETERVEAKVVGILGVGGVGKTTLAKEFFNLRRSRYSKSSFLFNVREKRKPVNYLQRKLLGELAGMYGGIESDDEVVGRLRKYLSSCHALIVVDDVDDASQIEALLSFRAVLNPDSLILATTRDKHVLISSGVLKSSIYNMKGMSQLHSKELFCCYAFNRRFPSQEFADLTDRFVKTCHGLPLSLKVFGALVCGQSECYWEATLDELDKILPNTEIQKSLKISYDSLSLDDQQIFLDIASFFIGEKRDVAIRIWGLLGFQNLQDKCLLDVDAENSMRMHDHIRDMGRNIARGLGTRRLWQQSKEDIDDLLEQSSPISDVRGITMLYYNYFEWRPPQRSEMAMPWRADSRSCDLEFVATEGSYLKRILKKAPSPNLRWLRWYDCPYSCLPCWIPMENLRVLEVAGVNLETLWQEESGAPLQLRELRIGAHFLFSKFPKSIGQLKHLEKITISLGMASGSALKSLPEEFCELPCLKYLELERCEGITSLPDSFGRLTRLQHIKLDGAESLRMLPESFGNLNQLKSLDLIGCVKLAFSGTTLGNITTLEYLDISGCDNVTELPTQIERQLSLKELHMDGVRLKELPSWIGNLCNLEALTIGHYALEVLPPFLPRSLKNLVLSGARRLKYLPDHFLPLTQLESLRISYCGIEHLPQELLQMNNLLYLEVKDCPLLELPFGEERDLNDDKCLLALRKISLSDTEISEVFFPGCVCPNLQSLQLQDCMKLTQIGGLSGLSKLQYLNISACVTLEELKNLEMLISLKTLDVSKCKKLRSIPGLGQLKNLRNLLVSECDEMLELSGAKHLMSLKILSARGCPKLRWGEGEGELEQLRQRLKAGLST